MGCDGVMSQFNCFFKTDFGGLARRGRESQTHGLTTDRRGWTLWPNTHECLVQLGRLKSEVVLILDRFKELFDYWKRAGLQKVSYGLTSTF